MSKIGFLTDSCSDIPQELADKYGIEVVGFPINLDGVEYMERKDFTNDQFYQMMRDAQGVPTTAAITQLQFCDIYARYADEGYTDLVYLSINAGGSSTYNNAVKAMELLEEERPGYTMKIQVIDSHTYSMPYGWYFCECARKVRNGGELASCVAELKQKLDCVEICLAAYSLKQMKKSGRVSAAAAVVGDLLGIRPIISLNAGVSKVDPMKTMFTAFKYAKALYILPILFYYRPALLLQSSLFDIALTFVTVMLGLIAFAAVWENYLMRRTTLLERLLLLGGALLLFIPGHIWDFAGIGLFTIVYCLQRYYCPAGFRQTA